MYILAHRWTGFQTSLSNQWIRRQINVDWLNQKRLSISCGSVIGLQCYIDMEAFFLCRPPWYRTRVQCYFSNQWLLSRRDNRLVGNGFGNSHSGNRNLRYLSPRFSSTKFFYILYITRSFDFNRTYTGIFYCIKAVDDLSYI